jgi:hypothetical protein
VRAQPRLVAAILFVAACSSGRPPEFGRAVLDRTTAGAQTLREAIDPARGLILIDHYSGGGTRSSTKLCGDELAQRLPAIADEVARERKEWEGFELACADQPQPVCVFNPGEVLEYGTRYLFVRDGGRYRLEAIVHYEGGAMDTTAQDQYIADQLAAGRAKPCP